MALTGLAGNDYYIHTALAGVYNKDNMLKIFASFAFFLLLSGPAGAAGRAYSSLNSVKSADIPAAALPAAVPQVSAPAHRSPKDWTVIYYSTTKDQLRYSMMWGLLDMKKTGSTDKVNVVIQAAVPIKHADGSISTPTIRMALGAAGNPDDLDAKVEAMFKAGGAIDESVLNTFSADIISQQNATDTGDWHNVADFTRWAKANYPASHYAFLIYGHGNGFFDSKKTHDKGTLIDVETKDYVTLPELRLLMQQTGHVDAFIMTSCIMQMGEVAWQVKDYTDAIVGSSELMWSVGYDLDGMLKTLNSNPSISGLELGNVMAKGYVDRVTEYKLAGAHASVIQTSKLPEFGAKLDAWVDAELALNDKGPIAKGVAGAARFDIFGVTLATTAAVASRVSMSGDLYDFVSIVTANTPQDTPAQQLARQTGSDLMDFISNGLVYKYYYTGKTNTGFDFSRAHGLSVHVPPVRLIGGSWDAFSQYMEEDYFTLPFATETKWGAFLNWVYVRK